MNRSSDIPTAAWHTPFPPVQPGLATIVIPNYNHGAYLPDAVDSALAQTYPRVEIIVVDDGSTDNSRAIIEQYGSQIRSIMQPNQGLSAARNSGIAAATGEFICVLDADDLLEANYLSTLIAQLTAHPEAAAVTCGYRFVDQALQPLPQVEARQMAPEQLVDALLAGNFLVPESILVRRCAYEAAGPFDHTLRACEDLDMWLRIASRYPVRTTAAVLTRHRILAGSMSTDPQRMHDNRLRVFEKHLGPLPDDGRSADRRTTDLTSRAFLTSTVEYLQVEDVDTAFERFKQAVRLNPALLQETGFFYEIVLGRQPKGWRGDFETAQPAEGYATGFQLLERLLRDPELGPAIKQYEAAAQAQLALAAGLIAYGQNNFSQARRWLMQAISHQPTLLLRRDIASRLLKMGLGLKQIKARF